ncbi:MAG: hypothetical protein HY321_11490 [Armatimonadetes bacterium]|nr:hypothetical protein [Armatimonadota bacterium]
MARKRKPGKPVQLATPKWDAGRKEVRRTRVRAGGAPGSGGPVFAMEAPPALPFGMPGGRTPDRRAGEKSIADMHRLIREREFSSADEANAYIRQFTGPGAMAIPSSEPSTPLERAQQMTCEAFGASGKRRVELAREALAISPDCADAYVLLAEEAATTAEEACDLYRQGVEAGERVLGPEMLEEEEEGHFWGMLETRPYMRARAGLARCLWLLGRHDEATAHWRDLLRLNQGDNQGNRHFLISALLQEGRREEARQLLAAYPNEVSTTWLYSRALLAFQEEGARRAAARRLRGALEFNPAVPDFLLGRRPLPEQNAPYATPGGEEDAVVYARDARPAWEATEGALEWLASESDYSTAPTS